MSCVSIRNLHLLTLSWVCGEIRLKTTRKHTAGSPHRWPSGKGCMCDTSMGWVIGSGNQGESRETGIYRSFSLNQVCLWSVGIYSPPFLKLRPQIPFSSKASWQPSKEWQSSFWSVSGECSSTVRELNLSDSQKNVRYIFQLFLKHAPWELFPFVSCQNDVKELLQTLGCHQPPLFIHQVFSSISQSMFGTQKAQAKNFAWWVAPLSLGTPLSERKLRRNLVFHVFLPAYETCGGLPKAESRHFHWHWQRWRSELMIHLGDWIPLLLGKECLVAQTLIYVMLIPPLNTPPGVIRDTGTTHQMTFSKLWFSLSPMDIGSRGFRVKWVRRVCC